MLTHLPSFFPLQEKLWRTSLAVQWLGLGAPTARAWVLSLLWGTKIPQAAWHSPKKKEREREREKKIVG